MPSGRERQTAPLTGRDSVMGNSEDLLRAQWRADLSRIAGQIDDLKVRIDAQSQQLYDSLSAEVAALQSDLAQLEGEVEASGSDAHARQIAAQIEKLSAKGDAAYQLLQSGQVEQIDPTDAEIKRLQAVEANVGEDAKAKIQAHIDRLRTTRTTGQASARDEQWTGQASDEPR